MHPMPVLCTGSADPPPPGRRFALPRRAGALLKWCRMRQVAHLSVRGHVFVSPPTIFTPPPFTPHARALHEQRRPAPPGRRSACPACRRTVDMTALTTQISPFHLIPALSTTPMPVPCTGSAEPTPRVGAPLAPRFGARLHWQLPRFTYQRFASFPCIWPMPTPAAPPTVRASTHPTPRIMLSRFLTRQANPLVSLNPAPVPRAGQFTTP